MSGAQGEYKWRSVGREKTEAADILEMYDT